jgi:vesicle-fusing ATPase
MKKNGLLANDVDLEELARCTKNYTGAEIAAVCGSARNYALFGREEQKDLAKAIKEQQTSNKFVERMVSMIDFRLSLDEIKPAFGIDDKSLENHLRGGIYNHGSEFL